MKESDYMYRESLIECVLIDIVSYVKNKKEKRIDTDDPQFIYCIEGW